MSSTPTGRNPVSGSTALLVGIIVRAHGLRGELVVEVRTDSPEQRFAPGAALTARSAGGARVDTARSAGAPDFGLTVESSRPHSGRLLVRFAEVPDRTAAEGLRGTQLLIDSAELPPTGDPDEFHVHQLEGLRAELVDGAVVGIVREVVHGPGGELLVLARPELPDALVPFVRAIVPTVDLDGGRIVLTPPEGLLDPG
ncbi:ribosome maturation factor RimM [Pseudonocardia asaccharolytica]|uniref:Ribosome maturation factor RimM n=1 Tax=Pseudonocardia asaccharolytica DSM 44247 = NBRC 16224 TaxID=1123024 RepID=A0A511CYY0_9PSEU|nr:ribosome maturation factor RimM [Pseudonocardia asaccharolytica]GEL17765.1 ribosome maturation factor RimM [Pseudonocardia asaccharolytica DSM 44247 = NBRC 16224]